MGIYSGIKLFNMQLVKFQIVQNIKVIFTQLAESLKYALNILNST